jgi:hypothetical protein
MAKREVTSIKAYRPVKQKKAPTVCLTVRPFSYRRHWHQDRAAKMPNR